MAETAAKANLSDFVFVPQGEIPARIVTTPSFPSEELAERIFEKYHQIKTDEYDGNPNLRLSLQDGQLVGSNVFDSLIIDGIVRPFGIRTANLFDLSNPEIMRMAKGNHYVDARSLVLRSVEDSINGNNNGLVGKLAEHIDMGQVETGKPALITGLALKFLPEDKSYGLGFVPADDFAVLYDDRLTGEWNCYKFDKVDENGLPLHLDKKKGARTWYTRNNSLSGWSLNENLDLVSSRDRLAFSVAVGRIALVSGEATGADFPAKLRELLWSSRKANLQ